jgi:transposase
MRWTACLQGVRKMRFLKTYEDWQSSKLSQAEAARILGVCERTFRRYINRFEDEGEPGLEDKRLSQASHRRAPLDEVMALTERYQARHMGWNVKHFYAWYQREGGNRSYSWVKNQLQSASLVAKSPGRGKHRRRRQRAPLPGMMLHQDGSTHEWVPDKHWDLIVTLDDATSKHYSMFFVEEEGTVSSFLGVKEVIEKQGLFCSLYVDRGSHYWHTPEAGGKVDKRNPTQFGRGLRQLGIELIPAYSPEARGRSERAFGTHQERLPKELALAGITDMAEANRYLAEVYMPNHNAEFTCPATEEGTAFIPAPAIDLDNILCEQFERTVNKDNCVSFEGRILQIPAQRHRLHYVKAKVRVHRYLDGNLAIFHGPRCLANYDAQGNLLAADLRMAA